MFKAGDQVQMVSNIEEQPSAFPFIVCSMLRLKGRTLVVESVTTVEYEGCPITVVSAGEVGGWKWDFLPEWLVPVESSPELSPSKELPQHQYTSGLATIRNPHMSRLGLAGDL